ncbi:hypothetical protein C9446_07895 [Providencia heimbachae]|nr:hypothetical protein C9446_07895 [Providencia heimbachae]
MSMTFNMRQIKKVLVLTISILQCSHMFANEDLIVIGTGISAAPVYEGSKKYLLGPTIEAAYAYMTDDYGIFSLSLEGAFIASNLA